MYGLKTLALLLVMSIAVPALADSLTGLPVPPGVEGMAGRKSCVVVSFNAGHSIDGVCTGVTSPACSGRGCNPATFTAVYIATWDAEGNVVSAVECSYTRHHTPQVDTVTYFNGYTSCPAKAYNPTGTVVVLDGIPFWYVATDPATGDELVNSNVGGYLYSP